MARRAQPFLRESLRRRLVIGGFICLASAVCGALYGLAAAGGAPLGLLRGALTGLFISVPLTALEVFYVQAARGRGLRRLPFVPLLAIKSAIYLAIFVFGLHVGDVLTSPGQNLFRFDRELVASLAFSAGFAVLLNFVLQVDRLLGRGVLVSFLVGRYHRPREEARIFLFLDLVGSTALAERLGGPRFLDLLNRVYGDMAVAIVAHRGDIHKYVGDEVIVTWTPRRGLAGAVCVRCVFAIVARIAAGAVAYTRDFGVVPQFRAALHYGTVITGELGDLKQEIAFLGDAMNTTARLVDACREHGQGFIASGDLIDRLALPGEIMAESLGAIRLRGKTAALPLFALSMPG